MVRSPGKVDCPKDCDQPPHIPCILAALDYLLEVCHEGESVSEQHLWLNEDLPVHGHPDCAQCHYGAPDLDATFDLAVADV